MNNNRVISIKDKKYIVNSDKINIHDPFIWSLILDAIKYNKYIINV